MTLFRAFIFTLFSAFLLVQPASAQTAGDDHLTIVTGSGAHKFEIEVMRSNAELERGLMFRRTMAQDKGMLFDFKTPQTVSMWMKNTYLPLDMLFIGQDGRVVSIKENAEPLSETTIGSGGLVTGVLEVNAGTAKRIGVEPGDLVHHPMFGSKG